jgi:group I intron endonuclease
MNETKAYYIYALLCPKCNCPRYVGMTSDIKKRYSTHLMGNAKNDCSIHKKKWVQKLLDQGLKPDIVVLLKTNTINGLDEAEKYWIKEMKRRGCPLTNLTDGGFGGSLGIPCSEEKKAKISASGKGKIVPQERRDKIAATLMGRPSPKKGIPLTPEQLISHAIARAIPPFKDQHGRIYKTIKEAADRWGIPKGNICHCLKGRRQSAGGLQFTYVDGVKR